MTRSFTGAFAVYLGISALLILAAVASGDVPRKISYQGRLTDGAGLPLAGPHTLAFTLYDSPTGGSAIWSETKTEDADSSGVFSTLLGSVNPIEAAFDGPCWLEIEVDGQILSPRREIVSVPFAYRADRADSAYSAAEASNASALGGRPAEAFADSSVDGHSLDAADGSPEDAVYVDNSGRVGVGTSTPTTFLDVRTLGGAEGGVSPYAEVLGHFRTTGSDAHSAISIDAQPGKDAILYFAQNGASMWDLRNDTGIGDKFQLRWHRAGTVRAVTVDTTGYVGVLTTTPNGPLHVQSTLSINSGTRLTDRVAPLVVGDGDGANPCLLIDGNQIEQADTSDLVYINYNSPADVALAQGGGNVGIGTITPGARLEVAGQVKLTSGPSGSGLWLASGYEGIGTSTPNGPLHVESSINISSGTNLSDRKAPVVVGDGDGTAPCILIDGNQIEQSDTTNVLYLNFSSPARIAMAQGGGNVGIGTSSPDAKLEVAGQVKITGGSPGTGKVLSSDAGGLASWQALDVEYMVNPSDNAMTHLYSDVSAIQGAGQYRLTSDYGGHFVPVSIPVHIQSRVGDTVQKIKSLKIYYQVSPGSSSRIDHTWLEMAAGAGSFAVVLDSETDRTSSTWTSYTLTDASPDPISGHVSINMQVYIGEAGEAGYVNIGNIILTTGP